MRSASLGNAYLIQLAGNSLYNHLASLRAARVYITHEKKKPRRHCKGCQGDGVPTTLPDEVVYAVVHHRKLLDDLKTLIQMHDLDRLVVNLKDLRTVLKADAE